MPSIHRQALVPYTVEQMYQLVNDIASYPQFLPHCRAAHIHWQRNDELQASIELTKGALHKSFTTRNRLRPHQRIDMQLVDGPFKYLHGAWRFQPMPHGSQVTLDLDFEFSNTLMRLTLGPVFHSLTHHLVEAFVTRAQQIHREVSATPPR